VGSLTKLIYSLSENADRINLKNLNEVKTGNYLRFTEDNFDAPIEPVKKTSWERYEKDGSIKLARSYVFEDFKTLHYFINESLKFQEKINHHSEIKINHREVNIELSTISVNDITESDLKLARYFDEIYQDTQYFTTGRI